MGQNLFTQVETAIEVLKLKYLKARISYNGLYRQERFPLNSQLCERTAAPLKRGRKLSSRTTQPLADTPLLQCPP